MLLTFIFYFLEILKVFYSYLEFDAEEMFSEESHLTVPAVAPPSRSSCVRSFMSKVTPVLSRIDLDALFYCGVLGNYVSPPAWLLKVPWDGPIGTMVADADLRSGVSIVLFFSISFCIIEAYGLCSKPPNYFV